MNIEAAKRLFSIHFPASAKRIKDWSTDNDIDNLSILEQIDCACWYGFFGALKATGGLD